ERSPEIHPGCAARNLARGAQAQVGRPRTARHHGSDHGGPDVRNPLTTQHQGGADIGGSGYSEGAAAVSLSKDRRNRIARETRSTRCFFATTKKIIAMQRRTSFPCSRCAN